MINMNLNNIKFVISILSADAFSKIYSSLSSFIPVECKFGKVKKKKIVSKYAYP